jgi:hypothetical protein
VTSTSTPPAVEPNSAVTWISTRPIRTNQLSGTLNARRARPTAESSRLRAPSSDPILNSTVRVPK